MKYDAAHLPPLDAVLISHTHYDHLDIDSFKYLSSDIPVIMPTGTAGVLHPFVKNPVMEVAHWTTQPIAPECTVTPVPVRHYGGRLVPGLRYHGVNGYVLQMHGWTIYFAGDTSYGTHFKEIGHIYHIDVALLPLGGLSPRRLACGKMLNAETLQQAANDLRAKAWIPIHWGTFGHGPDANTTLAASASEGLRLVQVGSDLRWPPTPSNP